MDDLLQMDSDQLKTKRHEYWAFAFGTVGCVGAVMAMLSVMIWASANAPPKVQPRFELRMIGNSIPAELASDANEFSKQCASKLSVQSVACAEKALNAYGVRHWVVFDNVTGKTRPALDGEVKSGEANTP
jgi:hypothetical protein